MKKKKKQIFLSTNYKFYKKINVKQRSLFTNQLISYSYTSRSIHFQKFREVSRCPIRYNPHLHHTSFLVTPRNCFTKNKRAISVLTIAIAQNGRIFQLHVFLPIFSCYNGFTCVLMKTGCRFRSVTFQPTHSSCQTLRTRWQVGCCLSFKNPNSMAEPLKNS